MTLQRRIGLVYLPGALPCFEDFGNLPTDLVCAEVARNQEGIEGAILDTLNSIVALKRLGVNTTGIILNKLYVSYMTKETVDMIQQAFADVGVQFLGMIPRLDLEQVDYDALTTEFKNLLTSYRLKASKSGDKKNAD